VSAVIPTVAHAAIPLVMAKTGVIVSGVGTFHGAATVAVQAVALAPIAPLAIGGAVLVVSGVAVHRNRELVEAIGTSIANWAQDRVVASSETKTKAGVTKLQTPTTPDIVSAFLRWSFRRGFSANSPFFPKTLNVSRRRR
jgi:hypothetical protein